MNVRSIWRTDDCWKSAGTAARRFSGFKKGSATLINPTRIPHKSSAAFPRGYYSEKLFKYIYMYTRVYEGRRTEEGEIWPKAQYCHPILDGLAPLDARIYMSVIWTKIFDLLKRNEQRPLTVRILQGRHFNRKINNDERTAVFLVVI